MSCDKIPIWYQFWGWMIFYGGLGTSFDVDADGTTLGLDKVIEIYFQIEILRDILMVSLKILWQYSDMV